MGLFDKRDKGSGKGKGKKKGDDFDSPVERIDLSAPAPVIPEPTKPEPLVPEPKAPSSLTKKAPEPEPEPEPEEEEEDDYVAPAFGIDKAIELMRTLPPDNVELVVQVVKLTLESTRVAIPAIIDDATRRQDQIQSRIGILKEEIANFEKQIASRREEISGLEEDFAETSTVKDRLQLAEKLTKGDATKKAARVSSPGMPAVSPTPGMASKIGSKPNKLAAAKPAAAKPGAAKPGMAKPGVAKPGVAKPGAAKPGAGKPAGKSSVFSKK